MRKRGERTFDNKKIEKKEIFICVCVQYVPCACAELSKQPEAVKKCQAHTKPFYQQTISQGWNFIEGRFLEDGEGNKITATAAAPLKEEACDWQQRRR